MRKPTPDQVTELQDQFKPFKGQVITAEMLNKMNVILHNYDLEVPWYVKVGDLHDNLHITVAHWIDSDGDEWKSRIRI